MREWLKALLSQASITIWTILSAVSTVATFFPSVPIKLRPAALALALISFAWANFKVFQKERVLNSDLRQALAGYEARVSRLVIESDRGSRYILQPIDNVPRGNFRGGYFEFYLWIENAGARNSIITDFGIYIQELNRTFSNLVPAENLTMVRGRQSTMGINSAISLSTTGIVKIPPESATGKGTLLFHLPDITFDDFAAAGLYMQGSERRIGDLHCRLTVSDRTGTSAEHDFVLRED